MEKINWVLDPTHSELQFKVKHLMITTVTGGIKDFNATLISIDDDFSSAEIEFEGKLESIDTGTADRDVHLKSADFFDIEQFPTLNFKSTKFSKNGDEIKISGDLTIKGITKSVTLNAELGGVATDPWGNTKAGFTFETRINRTDFGLTWNSVLASGGVMVSEEVKILGEVQFVKQA